MVLLQDVSEVGVSKVLRDKAKSPSPRLQQATRSELPLFTLCLHQFAGVHDSLLNHGYLPESIKNKMYNGYQFTENLSRILAHNCWIDTVLKDISAILADLPIVLEHNK